MNATAIFWRFLWKEYRVMRAFWISMAVLAVLAQLAPVAFPGLTHYAAGWTFSFALIFPALYAVACGATMFAAEKEEETYEFLRSLPVTAWRILSGKLVFSVVSTVLLIGALRCTGDLLMNGRVVDGETETRLWGVLGLAAIEGLAWGMFFSLVFRRPLQAAILAIAAASLGVEFVVRSVAPWRHWDDLVPYVNALPYRTAIVAAVLFIDAMLTRGWLEPRATAKRRLFRWPRRAEDNAALTGQAPSLPAARGAVLGRLVWQTWRQSRGMMLMLGIGGAILVLSPFEAVFQGRLFEAERARIVLIAATATLMGACVYLADHEGRSLRFLTEQAVRPWSVWIARQVTWLAMLAVWTTVVHGMWFILLGGSEFLSAAREALNRDSLADYWANNYFVMRYEHLPPIALSVYLSIGAFACGQLASMFLRSGILAGFIGLVLSFILYRWAQLMQLYEISWLWTLCPIPIVLLFATWLRTPDWLLERNTWRGWLRVAAAIALPLTALLFAVPLYRIYQIPDFSPGFSPLGFSPPGFSPDKFARSIEPTDAAKDTAEMYRLAAGLLAWDQSEEWAKLSNAEKQDWLKENAKPLALLLEASKRPDCAFSDLREGDRTFAQNAYRLQFLLERSAQDLEATGKLDEAWTRYFAALRFAGHLRQGTGSHFWHFANNLEDGIYRDLPEWAAHTGQTRERILAAIKQLDELEARRPPTSDAIKADYLRLRKVVTGGPDAIANSGVKEYQASRAIAWSVLPWERSRALRLLNYFACLDLIDMMQSVTYDRAGYRDLGTRLLRTTLVLSPFYSPDSASWLRKTLLKTETRRRATQLIMAIVAWRIDHRGELPRSLDELVGVYLDRLPTDPYSGLHFWYVREGMAAPPELAPAGTGGWRDYEVPRKPFIWSIGEKVRLDLPLIWSGEVKVGPDRSPLSFANGAPLPLSYANGVPLLPIDVSIIDYNGGEHWRNPPNQYEVWLSGLWFEIL